MNTVYKLSFRLLLLFAAVLILETSCKKELENINIDQKGVPYGSYVPGLTLASMETNILIISPAWQYQLQQNLNADMYSGYMATASAFAGGVNNLTYFMMDGWNGFISSVPFNNVLNPWLTVNSVTSKSGDNDFYSIALILKVFAFHRLTDIHGPLPYKKYGQGNDVVFDGQDSIYYTFFNELKEATDKLTAFYDANPTTASAGWAFYDLSSYNGDLKKWIKLSNTLRLRLAMRISNVDPQKAKAEAEAAVNHKYGVLTADDGPFTISCNDQRQNPLSTLSLVWGDCSVGAPLECILGGYNDPRLPKYAQAAADNDVKGQYKGIRQGISLPNSQLYRQYSHPNINTSDPLIIMTAAESYFLRAEGALKGWNMGGTAQNFYEDGIKTSFAQWGVSGTDAYINDNISTPKPYVDTKNATNDVPAGSPYLSTITIKWEDAASSDIKLEKIITQKWIAMYPEGGEAWSEFRRTGYPKLFPVVVNSSNGEIPDGKFIKRIPYPTAITSTSPVQSKNAIDKYFGGHDGSYKPLWWMGSSK
jgi:hypothetical protein